MTDPRPPAALLWAQQGMSGWVWRGEKKESVLLSSVTSWGKETVFSPHVSSSQWSTLVCRCVQISVAAGIIWRNVNTVNSCSKANIQSHTARSHECVQKQMNCSEHWQCVLIIFPRHFDKLLPSAEEPNSVDELLNNVPVSHTDQTLIMKVLCSLS